jgi:hypothetical protein
MNKFESMGWYFIERALSAKGTYPKEKKKGA